jgi:hypothetical protein
MLQQDGIEVLNYLLEIDMERQQMYGLWDA